jgi:chaperone protein EcpD
MNKLLCALGAVAACVLSAAPAHANVVIAGTRVVFPATTGEVTVRLSNQGSQPALVEAWIDDGDPKSTPDTAKVPFLVTPPLARMNAGKGQSLRIVFTGRVLPVDRESLFWLNVLEIPPKPTARPGEEQNTLQFAVRSRLKLFYRPAGLAGDPDAAAAGVRWTLVHDAEGDVLQARNESPFYVTFTQAALEVGSTRIAAGAASPAVPPCRRLPLTSPAQAPAAGASVHYTVIDDYGATRPHESKLTP